MSMRCNYWHAHFSRLYSIFLA